jgi:hypothetical protein
MSVGPNPWTGGDLHFGDLDLVRVHTQDSVFAAHRSLRSDRGNAPFLEEGGLIRGTADERLCLSVVALHLVRKTEVSSHMRYHASSVRLVTSRQLRVRTDAQVRPLLCYPMPATPLS